MRKHKGTWETDHGMMHARNGSTARYVAGRLGVDPATRVRSAERDLETIRRTLALQVRQVRRIIVGNDQKDVTPGPDGYFVFSRDDEYIRLFAGNAPHELRWGVDIDAIIADLPEPEVGCTEVVKGIEDCNGTQALSASCDALLEFKTSTFTAGKLATAGTPGNLAIEILWCAPECPEDPPFVAQQWLYGNPDGWLSLCVSPSGNPCAEDGSLVCVPYWAPGEDGGQAP